MAAIMPTLLSGIANGARQGILFKSGTHLETIGRVRRSFGQTGTLTTGQLQKLRHLRSQPSLKIESFKSLLLWKFF